MNWKIIAKYSLTLYVALILSGIPIGYLMAGIDPSGVNVPDWLIVYNYLAISIIPMKPHVVRSWQISIANC